MRETKGGEGGEQARGTAITGKQAKEGRGRERGREGGKEGGKEGVEQMDGRTGGVLGGVWEGRTAKRGSNPGSCTYNHDRIQHKFHAHQLSAEPVCAARCETKCREAPCGTHML